MPAAKFEIVRKCKVCGELFKAKTIESWYCSPRCSKIAWKRRKDEERKMQRLDEVVKKIPSPEIISPFRSLCFVWDQQGNSISPDSQGLHFKRERWPKTNPCK